VIERNWLRLRNDRTLRRNLALRAKILAGIRSFFAGEDFLEIDPPALVPLPGMEPHLIPFRTTLLDRELKARPFHLHTSPEYALKKLLSAGLERIYALGHVFRNGEISASHNPEFTLLEWYRVGADYRDLMADCERLVVHLTERLGMRLRIHHQGMAMDLAPPWPRFAVGEIMLRHAAVDLEGVATLEDLLEVAHRKGYVEATREWPWEDVFYRIFLQEVEPHLPKDKPFFLIDYPVEMAALARPKPGAPRWVERFELYAGELELANAFSELTDPHEQRNRLIAEQRQRARMGRDSFPVDKAFLEALERGLPPCAGIALGVDRLVMLLVDARQIRDVLPFPAEDLLEDWSKAWRDERQEEL
jgi:lysyl-tRNA synthetase class 2